MVENKERIANFTSSQMYRLVKSGKGGNEFSAPGLTYIEEKVLEYKMQRSINTESYSRGMQWGKFMEKYVYQLVDFEYKLESTTTKKHPIIANWSGSPDLIAKGIKVGEIKCYEPKKFASYSEALLSQDIERIKKDFPAEYWQMVSNAIIFEVDKAEGIVFMPYESELKEIREMAANYDGDDQWKIRFIFEADKSELPYLPDGGHYKNLNTFEFTVPQSDKDFLTERVLLAIKLMNEKLK